jgi:hypothetical protein
MIKKENELEVGLFNGEITKGAPIMSTMPPEKSE